jgi:vitamin B12/bleomycin/antimicrobial peptide transport system ATP-binding/permease protein
MAQPLRIEARRFAGRVWELTKPYWTRSDERWRARVLLVAIVSMSLFLVYLAVLLNDWNRRFFNALENKAADDFGSLMLYFCFIAAMYIATAVYRAYLRQMLQMRWRLWLTREYLGQWLGSQVYYRLEQSARGTDNPDQRIADDLQQFTNTTLTLTLDLLQEVVTLVSFVIILWGVSGPLEFTLSGQTFVIPGYMVWAALAYAVVGSVVTFFVGRPLIDLNFRQERYEADFRFSLVRMREHAEGIALYRGERAERGQLEERLEGIRGNWWRLMWANKRLNFFTNGYAQVAIVFPYFVAGPRYFSGAITLGGLTQVASAFGTVQSSLSWFVTSYASLASWKASSDRLLTFAHAVDDATAEAREHRGVRVEAAGAGTAQVRADDVDLMLPNGRSILADASFAIAPAAKVLVSGPSGSGKSTLFRAIAGLWPFGKGRVAVPTDAKVMFLPQKPYIPIGTLANAVSYPAAPGTIPAETIHDVLRAVRLDGFLDRLDESRNWSLVMSGGEQQKLAIARALIAQPDYLFLDEATASLDEPTERYVYELLAERLPRTALVSIAHRSQVAGFHDRRLTFIDGRLVPS